MSIHTTKAAIFGAAFAGLSAGVLMLSGCSFSGSDSGAPQGLGNGGFSSAENVAACSGKSAGDSCEFPSRDGNSTVSGSCKQMKNSDTLSCMPDRPMGGNGNGTGMGSGPRSSSSSQ
ncbi:MAG: hypothetical protein IPK84_02380 [Candidatus Moraniibacteriota bacterium]|nr:MAG: hypothetical protein IPK84_02380 [Candidatus Moranbacteria bacterium]